MNLGRLLVGVDCASAFFEAKSSKTAGIRIFTVIAPIITHGAIDRRRQKGPLQMTGDPLSGKQDRLSYLQAPPP